MTELSTLSEVREAFEREPARVDDPQLLALLVAKGAARKARGAQRRKRFTAIALGEALYASAGRLLPVLVRRALAGEVDWERFAVSERRGFRLMAAFELARRWRRGLRGGGRSSFPNKRLDPLAGAVFRGQATSLTEAELLALLLTSLAAVDQTRELMRAFGNPRKLMLRLTPDSFAPSVNGKSGLFHVPGSDVEIRRVDAYQLLAGVELARRYAGQAGGSKPPAARGDTETGLNLPCLLDPASPIDDAQRAALIAALRTHPRFTEVFARLEALASAAGTQDLGQAAKLHRMFEILAARHDWQHPAEILGSEVPYAPLLAIAAARLAEPGTEPQPSTEPARVMEIKERIEAAVTQNSRCCLP